MDAILRRLLLVAALVFCAVPAGATLSVVQAQAAADTTSTKHTSYSVSISTTAGNLLVAAVRESLNNTDTFSVTDGASQTWTQTGGYLDQSSSSSGHFGFFYKANSAAVTSVTANFTTNGGVSGTGITVMEISGAALSSPQDGTTATSRNSTSVTSLTSGSLTTTNANDILIYAVSQGSPTVSAAPWTAGTGYTIPTNGSGAFIGLQYQIVSATQSAVTTSISWTGSHSAAGFLAAFKAASGASPCANAIALLGAGCK